MADTIYTVSPPVLRTIEVIKEGSLSVIEAIKQGPAGVPNRYADSATTLSVNASLDSVLLLPSNPRRMYCSVLNNSVNSALYIALGEPASTTSFSYVLYADDAIIFDIMVFTGDIYGYWDIEQGTAQVLELYNKI